MFRRCVAVFLYTAFLVHAGAAEPLTVSLPIEKAAKAIRCSPDHPRALTVSWQGVEYLIEVPELAETPIISSAEVCRSFLPNWLESVSAGGRKSVDFSLEPTGAADGPQYRLRSDHFSTACRESGYCVRDLFDYLSLRSDLRACQPRQNLASLWERMRPRLMRPRYEMIHRMDVAVFPFQPFTEVLKETARGHPGAVFASTMTIGDASTAEISRALEGLKNPVFIALDAGLMFAGKQGPLMTRFFLYHPAASVLPITSGREIKSVHHLKLVFAAGSPHTALSSMNFSTPLKTAFSDLIYAFDDPAVSAELQGNLYQVLEKQCERFDDYRCLVDFSYPQPATRKDLYDLFDQACRRFATWRAEHSAAPRRKSFFMQPQDTDLAYLATTLIGEARQEVVILTHKFSLSSIMDSLESAAQRGVRVVVLASKPPGTQERPPRFYHYPGRGLQRQGIPEPHMKVMIIDRTRMFFGTGNFSQNAFNDAREAFAVTDDRAAIAKVLRMAASIYHAYAPGESENFGLGQSVQAWVAAVHPGVSTEWLPPHTSRSQEAWLARYRRVDPAFLPSLRACGLGHLLIIPEEDYLRCAAKRPAA